MSKRAKKRQGFIEQIAIQDKDTVVQTLPSTTNSQNESKSLSEKDIYELDKAKHDASFKGKYLQTIVTVFLGLLTCYALWKSGVNEAKAERLRIEGEKLTADRAKLQQEEAKLLPMKKEDEALNKLRGIDQRNIDVLLQFDRNFGHKFTFRHVDRLNKPFGINMPKGKNPELHTAIGLANQVRSLSGLRLANFVIEPSDMRTITHHEHICKLLFFDCSISDDALEALLPNRQLSHIAVVNCGLKSIAKSQKHQAALTADFSFNDIDSEGIKHIGDFYPNLTYLALTKTKVDDGCIDSLLNLRQLKLLHIRGTGITSAGLLRLFEMPSLQDVYVMESQVTKEAKAEIAKAKKYRLNAMPVVTSEKNIFDAWHERLFDAW